MEEVITLLVAVGASALIVFRARRHEAPFGILVLGAVVAFVGCIAFLLGSQHTIAVVGRALRQLSAPGSQGALYDFRRYSLLLLGALLITTGLRLFAYTPGLVRREHRSWKGALWTTVVLLAINAPLMPIQGFAIGFTAFGVVTLLLLFALRRFFPDDVASAPDHHQDIDQTTSVAR
jgi:hypothetical protein